MLAFVLAMIGALNWGLIGLGSIAQFNGNLVNMIFGSLPIVESLVYILVGASAVFLIVAHKRDCKVCAATVQI